MFCDEIKFNIVVPSLVKYSHDTVTVTINTSYRRQMAAPRGDERHLRCSVHHVGRLEAFSVTPATSANDAIVAQKNFLHVDCEYPL